MKCFLIAALSATALSALAAATPAAAQATAPGAPRGSAPVTAEGYGPSSAIVCDQAGTTCWHSVDRYDYPSGANVVVRTMARTTPGESTPDAGIGRATNGSSSDPSSAPDKQAQMIRQSH